MSKSKTYIASEWKDEDLMNTFHLQMNDARDYFLKNIKPQLDRSYKLYIGYTGDRAKKIKKWQANVFVPYVQAVVETLMPRILDARPEFSVQGRTEASQAKSEKQQKLADYFWEKAKMEDTMEDVVRSSLIYGMGYIQVYWKKDSRILKFLTTKDISKNEYKYEEQEKVFYDAPFAEWVDNYELWYDWHNSKRESKQYWFRRLVLSRAEIMRRYPSADPKRIEMAFASPGGDLEDYASVREEVNSSHEDISTKNPFARGVSGSSDKFNNNTGDKQNTMYEVFEWHRPFEDEYSVHVGAAYVPIIKGGSIPFPYDFKETQYIDFPYLKVPGKFEGVGIPMILENPQIMLNMIKNQRLDSVTLSIHKMWIVNPLANVNKDELVTRPFGIIYSQDPNGVREVQFGDIKQSAYREEELLKSDMRYSSGVDDFSMGAGGAAGSATEVRHLRESTLERVRLFVNHLGSGLSTMMRYWIDMQRQFFTEDLTIKVTGDDGAIDYPLIEKDDLLGMYEYRATVLPAIAGQNDIKKKQDMDLFQLLVTLPFVDQRKLTAKVLQDWSWSLDSIAVSEEAQAPAGPEMDPSMMDPSMMDPSMMDPSMMGAPEMAPPAPTGMPTPTAKNIPNNVLSRAMALLRDSTGSVMPPAAASSPFAEARMPINIARGPAPTAQGVPAGSGGPGIGNPRGMNRKVGGKVDTNINVNKNSNPESALMNRVFNTQR